MMEKVALVTGSSRGIGAATATLLAREGWAVCINYLEQRRSTGWSGRLKSPSVM